MNRFPLTRGQSSDDERSESCASCYFWNPWFDPAEPQIPLAGWLAKKLRGTGEGGRGECRRHAPTGSNRWHWTDGNDWCGDYEQRPNGEPPETSETKTD